MLRIFGQEIVGYYTSVRLYHYNAGLTPNESEKDTGLNTKPWPILFGHYIPMTVNIYNRKYLEQVLPMPENDWRIATDIYVNQLAPLYGEVYLFKTPLSNYRIHGHNLWVTPNSNKEIWLRDLNSLEKSAVL